MQLGLMACGRFTDQPDLIIEAKTTDYITISLERLEEYKEKLVAESK